MCHALIYVKEIHQSLTCSHRMTARGFRVAMFLF